MLSIDTETELITPGNLTPDLICVSYARNGESGVLGPREGVRLVHRALESGERVVGHNIAFDMGVLMNYDQSLAPLIFQHYDKGLVRDTMIREMLYMIREGTFKYRKKGQLSLAGLAQKYLRMELDKSDDGWRTRYTELKGKPISVWPKEAVKYAEEDAQATLGVYQCQDRSPDEELQCKAAWALHLLSVRGVITDPDSVARLKGELETAIGSIREQLIECGILRAVGKSKPKLTKDTALVRKLVLDELGKEAPRTAKSERHPEGQVKIDAKTIQKTKNPNLHALVEFSENEKLLTTYVPVLERGTSHPINARFNVLVDTGRTSCSGPNLQNLPRKDGVRQCYIPRPGYIFAACDYDAAELRALAQVTYAMFGESKMREAIIRGEDLHLALGATILGVSYEEAEKRKRSGDKEIKEARQFAKIANFGFPGGLGAVAFVKYANGMGYDLTDYQAKKLRDAWFQQWPEMRPYFERAAVIADKYGPKKVVQMGSGRIRGGVTFTQAANSMFQGLVADGAKHALFNVVYESYVDQNTALFGCYPMCFVHDEILVEVPVDKAAAAAERLSRVMNEGLQQWLPDVPVTSEAHLMLRWEKDAEPVFDSSGRLVPWQRTVK